MKNKLYKKYVDDIEYYLTKGRGFSEKPHINGPLNESLEYPTMSWQDKTKNEANFRSLKPLNALVGREMRYEEKLGAHPSFSYLKESNKSEYHYIVSMFIDIKNSTELFKKYDPDAVANICRIIQLAAIHTCWYFDGYIQRLQGDGLMVYFGGKGIAKQTSVDNALMAASFVSYFVKNDLKDLFEANGVKRIYTRIGIDYGDSNATLWHNAGVGECSEVTTTSLHTSLSCKMQSQAESNGVIVGDNILLFDVIKECFEYKKYKINGEERPFVYESLEQKIYYKQHTFFWERYIRKHPLISIDSDNNLVLREIENEINPHVINNMKYLEQNANNYKPYIE